MESRNEAERTLEDWKKEREKERLMSRMVSSMEAARAAREGEARRWRAAQTERRRAMAGWARRALRMPARWGTTRARASRKAAAEAVSLEKKR